MRFLDTNVILDLFGGGGGGGGDAWHRWSTDRYGDALEAGTVVCNLVVLAELSSNVPTLDRLSERLRRFEIELAELSDQAAFRAGQAHREYRRRGGTRGTILPDFLIAAHAAVLGASLVTRDRRLAGYFPDLTLITPETQP